jgi:hypothetical protein
MIVAIGVGFVMVSCSRPTSAPKAESFTEVVHGESVSDEYRWMESPARAAEVTAWLK